MRRLSRRDKPALTAANLALIIGSSAKHFNPEF